MLDKIIYFSGIHGSGKSTLINELTQKINTLKYTSPYSITLEDTYIRAVWRITKSYLETCDHIELLKNNKEKIILADRCIYDNFSYMKGFLKMGWISNNNMKQFEDIVKATFDEDHKPKNIIYLSPPKEFVINNILKRWENNPKKWREDNFEYLEKVMKEYDKLYSKDIYELNNSANILTITATDIQSRKNQAINWIEKIISD